MAIMKKKILFLSLAVILVFVLILGAHSIWTSAKQEHETGKTCYENYVIRENESLWSIAKEYAPKLGMSTAAYVKELKRVNGMTQDKILAGGKIIVLYAEK